MSSSWFDDTDPPETTHDDTISEDEENSSSDQEESDNNVVEPSDSPKRNRKRITLPSFKVDKRHLFIGCVSAVIVLLTVSTVMYFMRDTESQPAAVAVSPSSSDKPKPEVTTSSSVSQRCPDQPKSSKTSPKGIVVAFQKAYFAGNNDQVLATVEESSYLADVDWVTSAGDTIGSDFCVKINDVSDDFVDVTTTVRTSAGEELVFLQRMHTVKVGKEFKITAIEDRDPSAQDA